MHGRTQFTSALDTADSAPHPSTITQVEIHVTGDSNAGGAVPELKSSISDDNVLEPKTKVCECGKDNDSIDSGNSVITLDCGGARCGGISLALEKRGSNDPSDEKSPEIPPKNSRDQEAPPDMPPPSVPESLTSVETLPIQSLPACEAVDTIPNISQSDSGYGTISSCGNTAIHSVAGDCAAPAHTISSSPNCLEVNREPGSQADTTHLEMEDNKTVYSDAMSLSDTMTNGYASGLAEDLFEKLNLEACNAQMLQTLSDNLPGLLKALALKFGHGAPSQMHRDVMYFLHKHHM